MESRVRVKVGETTAYLRWRRRWNCSLKAGTGAVLHFAQSKAPIGAGNKNDETHLEQKNRTHVRELAGYLRFDTKAELDVFSTIWELDRPSPTSSAPRI
jgi:hypothetical protein